MTSRLLISADNETDVWTTAKLSGTIAGVGLASLASVVLCGVGGVALYSKVAQPLLRHFRRARLQREPVSFVPNNQASQ